MSGTEQTFLTSVNLRDSNVLHQNRGKERVMERRRFKRETPLDQRLEDHAKRLRKEAKGTPAGIKRDDLIRRARQAETAARMSEWLSSPGLQPPK
jgi:hypothetical protein